MGKRLSDYERSFRQGFALALAEAYRMHGCSVTTKDVMQGSGFTVAMFKSAGVDEYDLKELREAMR